MKIRKYAFALMIVSLILFILFLSVEKYRHKEPSEEMVLQEDEETADIGSDAVDGQEESESEKEVTTQEDISASDSVDYVDEELYAEIKDICKNIDFTASFDPGDVTKYDLYKEKYKEFIDGERTVMIKETGEEQYIYHLGEFRTDIELERFDIKDRYRYYFFDMNGNENPELCVTDEARYTYVFQYDEECDQIVLWKEYISSTIFLMGTQKLGFASGGWTGYGFISIDENGDYVFWLNFLVLGGSPYQNEIEDYGYLVSLPEYIELRDDMIEQAFYYELDGRYYFRVTEEQFEELTKDYENERKASYDALDEVTYTYTELFD